MGVSGAVAVENENGSIGVSGLRGGCNDISLKTSFGSISTDVPITMTTKSDTSLSGTIAGGGCRLSLIDSNGNITVGKE